MLICVAACEFLACCFSPRHHPGFPFTRGRRAVFKHRTARLTRNWDDGNIFPSIIAAAVSLTGARERELSRIQTGHSNMLVWTMRESSIWKSLSLASSWLHLLSSLSWPLSSLWSSFFPALLHQLLIAGY